MQNYLRAQAKLETAWKQVQCLMFNVYFDTVLVFQEKWKQVQPKF